MPRNLWPKGVSGNPGGRPKALITVVELCRAETEANVRTLIELRDNPKVPPAVRAACANSLLDRGWGKPLAADSEAENNRITILDIIARKDEKHDGISRPALLEHRSDA